MHAHVSAGLLHSAEHTREQAVQIRAPKGVLHMYIPCAAGCCRRRQACVVIVRAQGQGSSVMIAAEHPGRWSYATAYATAW